MSKIITIDLGSLTHQAIFGWNSLKQKEINGQLPDNAWIPPSHYTFFQMLISLLKRVGVSKEDTVILAGDGRNSWRKFFYPNYKKQRADFRESFKLIDWSKHYDKIGKVLKAIDEATNFHTIWLSNCWNVADILFSGEGQKFTDEDEIENVQLDYSPEADDVIAVCCKYFKDKEIVIISKDADLEQLCTSERVKFFSMNTKWKGGTGVYKEVKNAYKILAKKIEKGDVSDNILPGETDDNSEKASQIRELIIDLNNLPKWVELPIIEVLNNLPEKSEDFSKLPFQQSLAKRFPQIYSKDKIITYEDSMKRMERKKVRAKNKKKKVLKEKKKSMRKKSNGKKLRNKRNPKTVK